MSNKKTSKMSAYAKARFTLSELMEGKTKIETEEILGKSLTMKNFDLVSQSNGEIYSVIVFTEFPDKFYFGGTVLTDLCTGLIEEFGATASQQLEEDGGIKMILEEVKAKTKDEQGRYNHYVKVNIVE